MDFYERVIKAVLSGEVKDKEDLHKLKQKLAGELGLPKIPSPGHALESASIALGGMRPKVTQARNQPP